MIRITDQQLKEIYPLSTAQNRAKYLEPLNEAMNRYSINTPIRINSFLAVIGHETGQLSRFTENLNYSAKGLRSVFGKYFPNEDIANKYAYNPKLIANKVYANRMGNGSESSGDGYKYRGRGAIQITGKDGYKRATNEMYGLPIGTDFVLEPDLLETPEFSIESAAWWWVTIKNPITANKASDILANYVGQDAEYANFTKIVKIVNGGTNGLAERWEIYKRAKNIIK